jgi:hypothetical protein
MHVSLFHALLASLRGCVAVLAMSMRREPSPVCVNTSLSQTLFF